LHNELGLPQLRQLSQADRRQVPRRGDPPQFVQEHGVADLQRGHRRRQGDNAEKIAKYVTIANDPSSSPAAKDEAKFNLDMLQASIAAYAAQKGIVAGQSAEETAKKVLAFLVGVLIKIA
jgi:hypothetical protein